MRKLLKLFIILFLIVNTILYILIGLILYYKDTFARRAVNEAVRDRFPNALLNVESVIYKLPDRLIISNMEINNTSDWGRLHFSSIEIELELDRIKKAMELSDTLMLIKRISAQMNTFSHNALRLQTIDINILLDGSRDTHVSGSLSIQSITYKEIVLKNVYCDYRFFNHNLSVTLNRLIFAGGTGYGIFEADFRDNSLVYKSDFYLNDMRAADIFTILKLDNKLKATGLWNGRLSIGGTNNTLTQVDGKLTARSPGGTLNIQDKNMVANMLPSDERLNKNIMESVLYYTYNEGDMNISLEDDSILCDLSLEGETGKRNISIYLHNLF